MSTPHNLPPAGPGAPTSPIALAGGAGAASPRLGANRIDVPEDVVERLRDACAEVTTDRAVLADASRDWWPLAMSWATEGQVAGLAGAGWIRGRAVYYTRARDGRVNVCTV